MPTGGRRKMIIKKHLPNTTSNMNWSLFMMTWVSAFPCGVPTTIHVVASSYHRTPSADHSYFAPTIRGVYSDVESLSWCAMLASSVAPGSPFHFDNNLKTCVVGTAACVHLAPFSDSCWIPGKASHVNRCHYKVQNATGITWQQSQGECHRLGGYLPEIESDEELALIKEIVMKDMLEPVFIGGRRVGGKMTWASGAEMHYTAWYTGYPKNSPGLDCVLLWVYGWTSSPCNHTAPSLLCEFNDCVT